MAVLQAVASPIETVPTTSIVLDDKEKPDCVLTQNIVIIVHTIALPGLPDFRFCWLMILNMYMPILSFTPMLIL